ncbi:preprotein translocase subunit SecY [Malonomonas rubra]|uniref:preprotein translocase subunit SecY n=1 Tax=Malonomonas rubra TaxID=57040 RepID=UPI0034E97AD4
MMSTLQNIFAIPELRRRIMFTLGMLAVYRVGCHIPTPGVDAHVLAKFFEGTEGTLLGLVSAFTGGALKQMAVFALGIMPYISSSIIFQLLTVVFEPIEKLSKEGEQGRKKITQYTRYGTIALAIIQGTGIATGLQGMVGPAGEPVVPNPGIGFILMTVITLTAGTAFIMWLGEQITERGIGNGISLIIFAGIVAGTPSAIVNSMRLVETGAMTVTTVVFILALMLIVVAAIVYMESARRRVPIHYAKRVVGMRNMGGQASHLPLKINMSGVIPPIFASSIMMFPATIANFIDAPWVKSVSAVLAPSHWVYNVFYVAFIVFFCYFYTAITFNPVNVAENVKNQGGFVPGIRPGKETADYLDTVLGRLTFAGAIYISLVCVLPTLLINQLNVPFFFGGTSLLIVVGVGMDTASQIEAHLISRSYEGFMKGVSLKGRQG